MIGLNKSSKFWDALVAEDQAAIRLMLQRDLKLAKVVYSKRTTGDGQFAAGTTGLHVAAARGQTQVAAWLIGAAAAINATTEIGQTPLHAAAEAGHGPMIDLLLDKGAAIDAADQRGRTALHIACGAGHNDVAGLLLHRGADRSAIDAAGRTTLHWAAAGGCDAIVRRSLHAGDDVNVRDHKQRTPLHHAVIGEEHTILKRVGSARRQRSEKTVAYLLDHGADVNAIDAAGETPLDLLNYLQGDTEVDQIVQLLRRRGGRWVRYRHRHAQTLEPPAPTHAYGETLVPSHPPKATKNPNQTPTAKPIPLGDKPLIIGRDSSCDIRFRSRTLSRRHARINCEHGEFIIEDVGSRNGVIIDGARLTGPHVLNVGETITLGAYTFFFDGKRLCPEHDELTEEQLANEDRR